MLFQSKLDQTLVIWMEMHERFTCKQFLKVIKYT